MIKMQAYDVKHPHPILLSRLENRVLNTYQKKYETFAHTSTLLIHNLKYLSAVSFCFTTRKINVRV